MIPTPVAPGAEPATAPRFASVITPNGPGGAFNIIEPSAGKKDIGWNIGERPPREYMNWIHYITNLWVTYFKSWITYISDALPPVADNFAIDPATTTGLTLGLKSGSARLRTDSQGGAFPPDETMFFYAAQTKALTNNTTNYVYWDQGADVFVTTTQVAAQDRVLLYIIVTASGAINWASSFDCRTPTEAFQPATFDGANVEGYVPNPVTESKRFLMDDASWARPTPDAQAPTNSDYTFVETDAWQVVRHTGAGAQNWTVPTNASHPFKVGDIMWLSNEGGAGAITILAAGGVTITSRGDAGAGPWIVPANGYMAILMKVATNTWQFMVIPVPAAGTDTVYSGYVGSDGSTNNSLPPGWSAARTGGGAYTITHNLGLATARDLSVVVIPFGNASLAGRMESTTTTTNVAGITTYTTSTGGAGDTAFVFMAKRNA